MFFNYTKSRTEPCGIFFAQNFAIPKTSFIFLPSYLHKKMKSHCAMKNMTMGEYLTNLIVADIIN